MKKVKVFFIASLLVLITITVWAKRSKFDSEELYVYDAATGVYCQLTASVSLYGLSTTVNGSAQVTISNGTKTLSLYGHKGGLYYALYLTCTF